MTQDFLHEVFTLSDLTLKKKQQQKIVTMRFLHIGLRGMDEEEEFGTPKLLDIWKTPNGYGSQKFHCRIFVIFSF